MRKESVILRQERRRKDEVEIGKLERNEGVHGTGVLYFRDVGLNFDTRVIVLKRNFHSKG